MPSSRPLPTPVVAGGGTGKLHMASAVAAGHHHSLALVDPEGDGTGTVWAWGSDDCGQLGLGNRSPASEWPLLAPPARSTPPTPQPVRVVDPALARVTAIAAGAQHSLALDADGKVWAWGDDPRGHLGTRPYPQNRVEGSSSPHA